MKKVIALIFAILAIAVFSACGTAKAAPVEEPVVEAVDEAPVVEEAAE